MGVDVADNQKIRQLNERAAPEGGKKEQHPAVGVLAKCIYLLDQVPQVDRQRIIRTLGEYYGGN